MHIAHMQLDERDTDAEQRIADSDGGVRVGARVDDDTVDTAARGLDTVDDCALVIRLEGLEGCAERGGVSFAGGFHVGEGRAAVDVGFAGPEEVEVGAVDEEDGFAHFD